MNWDTRYPTGKLVSERAAALGLSKNAVVSALGHRNLNKGRRRLEALLASSAEAPEYLKRLAAVLEFQPGALDEALRATIEDRAETAKALGRWAFRPSLFVESTGADRRHPLFILAFSYGALKYVPLPPNIGQWPPKRQIATVGRIIRQHFAETGGQTGNFGAITGYRFQRTYDHTLSLSTTGQLSEPFDQPVVETAPRLTVKGKRIPAQLLMKSDPDP